MLRDHEQNFQKIWDDVQRSNIGFNRTDEGIEVKNKGMHKLFNEIISKNC